MEHGVAPAVKQTGTTAAKALLAIQAGIGGRRVLLDDPAGNVLELFDLPWI